MFFCRNSIISTSPSAECVGFDVLFLLLFLPYLPFLLLLLLLIITIVDAIDGPVLIYADDLCCLLLPSSSLSRRTMR